jgi:hypothetical protein
MLQKHGKGSHIDTQAESMLPPDSLKGQNNDGKIYTQESRCNEQYPPYFRIFDQFLYVGCVVHVCDLMVSEANITHTFHP